MCEKTALGAEKFAQLLVGFWVVTNSASVGEELVAAWAKSSMMPGTTPKNTMAAAAIVSATPVPASDDDARAGESRRFLGRRVHREDDAQVHERTDDGRDHADHGEPVLPDVDGSAEHGELGDEATRERHPRLRQQEQREQPREHRSGRGQTP